MAIRLSIRPANLLSGGLRQFNICPPMFDLGRITDTRATVRMECNVIPEGPKRSFFFGTRGISPYLGIEICLSVWNLYRALMNLWKWMRTQDDNAGKDALWCRFIWPPTSVLCAGIQAQCSLFVIHERPQVPMSAILTILYSHHPARDSQIYSRAQCIIYSF